MLYNIHTYFLTSQILSTIGHTREGRPSEMSPQCLRKGNKINSSTLRVEIMKLTDHSCETSQNSQMTAGKCDISNCTKGSYDRNGESCGTKPGRGGLKRKVWQYLSCTAGGQIPGKTVRGGLNYKRPVSGIICNFFGKFSKVRTWAP